ncbi:MAG: primosomal protein N' [bacterium]|nr:primosomal protein N' [bacterium]
MRIVEVIPLLRTVALSDGTLSYFSLADEVPLGALVRVTVRNKIVPALVVGVRDATEERFRLRKGVTFMLKPLGEFLSDGPVMTPTDVELGKWVGEYYAVPPASALRLFFPRYLWTKKGTLTLAALSGLPAAPPAARPALRKKTVSGTLQERFTQYARIAASVTGGGQVLIIFPDLTRAQSFVRTHLPESLLFTGDAPGRRHWRDWETIRSGAAAVIVGTRSAVFAPLARPAAIIIDEPSAEFYKSTFERPYYHGARVAEEKARRLGVPLILGSELFFPFEGHTAILITPPKGSLANIRLISLKDGRKNPDDTLAATITQALGHLSRSGGQGVIFINRRGAAPLTQCHDCGFVLRCANCEAPLVLHYGDTVTVTGSGAAYARFPTSPGSGGSGALYRCHHCGATSTPPDLCPNCRGARLNIFTGGTQKIEEEIHELQPDLAVFRLDSDAAEDPHAQRAILDAYRNTDPAVLVGTQLVTKLRLPGFQPSRPLRFIALASVDPLLRLPDMGMRERVLRTILALTQIPHEDFFIQTYHPEDPFLAALAEGRLGAIAAEEAAERSAPGYPPYGAFVKLTFRHRSDTKALAEAERLHTELGTTRDLQQYGCRLMGPAPAFIARVGGKYVWQLLVHTPPGMAPARRNEILANVPPSWEIDVDPVTIL